MRRWASPAVMFAKFTSLHAPCTDFKINSQVEKGIHKGRVDPFKVMENWFLDGEFMYVGYKEEIYGRDNSIFSSAGCGRKLMGDTLKIKISGDYSSDPYHDSDFRFMSVLLIEY